MLKAYDDGQSSGRNDKNTIRNYIFERDCDIYRANPMVLIENSESLSQFMN